MWIVPRSSHLGQRLPAGLAIEILVSFPCFRVRVEFVRPFWTILESMNPPPPQPDSPTPTPHPHLVGKLWSESEIESPSFLELSGWVGGGD